MQICTDHKIRKPFDGNYGISQFFGENPNHYKPYGFAGHFGIDFLTPWGTPIVACDDGEVSRVGYTSGNGNYVELKHVWGYSLYLHFRTPSTVTLGEKIVRGEKIGEAGNTGAVWSDLPLSNKYRGTHLHFSIKIDGIKNPSYQDWVDPMPHFEK
jgi:murein DD-endopeptidase MepM/ murein hydrolase activator NlpD